MEKKTRPSSKKSCDNIGIPKPTFYGAIVTIFTLGIGFVINTNVRLTALEKDNETYKVERKEIREKMDIMLDKLSNIETKLVLKADKKFQN